MNRKELLKRWRNAQYQPELFYAPVKKAEDDKDALIFDIYVENNDFYYTNLISMSRIEYLSDNVGGFFKLKIGNETLITGQPFYCLQDNEGNPVTPETYPNLFHDKPWHECDVEGNIIKLSKLLVINEKPFLKMECDGKIIYEQTSERYDITKLTFNGESGWSCEIIAYHLLMTAFETGREYTIKITGNIPQLAMTSWETGFKYVRIRQWGNLLNARSLNNMFSFLGYDMSVVIYDINTFSMPDIKTINYTSIVDASRMFAGYNGTYKDELEKNYFCNIDIWDFLSENYLSKFPNLVYADSMFYQSFNISYIPRQLFQNNKYLVSVYTMFAQYHNYSLAELNENEQKKCITTYIGEECCANLQYLTNIQSMFYWSYSNRVLGAEIVEDSIFENCVNLYNTSTWIYSQHGILKKIGNRIFKNCYKIETVGTLASEGNLLLEKIGDSVFENCTNLKTVSWWVAYAYRLKQIGKDIFKGCISLERCDYLFGNTSLWKCGALNLNIDSRQKQFVYYDHSYNTSTVTYSDNIDDLTLTFNSNSEQGTIEYLKDYLHKVYGSTSGYNFDYFNQFPYLYSEAIKELLTESIQKHQITDYQIQFGENMFTEECKQSVETISIFELGDEQGMVADHYTNRDNSIYIGRTYIQLYRGVMPDFWNYPNINIGTNSYGGGIFGYESGRYVTPDGTFYTTIINNYTNETDIPHDGKWLVKWTDENSGYTEV